MSKFNQSISPSNLRKPLATGSHAMTLIKTTVLAGFCAIASLTAAQAAPTTSAPYMTGTYSVSVIEALTNGSSINTMPGALASGSNTASASFTYTGALNFNNTAPQNSAPSGDLNSTFGFTPLNISGYSGSGTVMMGTTPVANYGTLTSFLASSGSASGYQYASLYMFDLGVLAAGTILDVTHDDGISIFQGATQINPTVSGPTTVVTDEVKLTGTGDTKLYYSRQNGTPSILQVDVPEPVSLALLGVGMIGTGIVARRRPATANR